MANLPNDELPSKFDVVVDGTGECQSLMRDLLYRVNSTILLHRPFYRVHLYVVMLEHPLITRSTRPSLAGASLFAVDIFAGWCNHGPIITSGSP